MQTEKSTKATPSILSVLNLTAGSAALFLASEGMGLLVYASYFILFAVFLDFLDGITRRSERIDITKELDSLAHLLSFGVAPAAILYKLIKVALKINAFSFNLPFTQILMLLTPVLIVIFSAWRLAKFNLDRRQSDSFIGMPTPVNAMLIASLPMIVEFMGHHMLFPELNYETWFVFLSIGLTIAIGSTWLLIPLIAVQSFLLVANFRMFTLRFNGPHRYENILRIVFVVISVGLIAVLQPIAVPFVVILFLIFSLVNNLIRTLSIRRQK